jgi:hypothetical protein
MCAKRSSARFMRALAAGAAMAAISGAADAAEVTPTNVPGVLAVAPPPAGFNAAVASEAERAEYALPPHPDATKRPADYARWQRAMSAKITRPAAALVQTRVSHGPAKFAASQAGSSIRNAYESTNWSGFAARNSVTSYSAQNSFDYVYAEFNIPTAANPTCKGIDYAAQWVGIDGFVGTYGYQSQDVLQAGVGKTWLAATGRRPMPGWNGIPITRWKFRSTYRRATNFSSRFGMSPPPWAMPTWRI